MKSVLKRLIKRSIGKLGVGITSYDFLQQLLEDHRTVADIQLILNLPDQYCSQLLRSLRNSRSQLRQDLFVLSQTGFKRNGFFVEFGAADGLLMSNTCLLEKDFGWTGILAEPAKCWQADLKKNRACLIETDCVWRESNSTLTFNEVDSGELSTIDLFSSGDDHRNARRRGKTFSVNTISLEDLLDKHHAPRKIDYLSIDTEGSEYEILSNFDFRRYEFATITCEHSFKPTREKIFSLLSKNGYIRKLESFSQYDDWYVRAE